MKSLVFALALAGTIAAAAPAANAADGCGWHRHFSPFVGHCVWTRFNSFEDEGPRFWWGGPFWWHRPFWFHRWHNWH